MARVFLLLAALAMSSAAQPLFSVYSKTVEQKDIRVNSDPIEAVMRVFSEEYAQKHGLVATVAEIAKLRTRFPQTQGERIANLWLAMLITNYKLNTHLWRKHGGRIALSAFGTHVAKDALLDEIAELERDGSLRFHDPQLRRRFFDYYRDYGGDGVVAGTKASKVFAKPLWEQ